mgnify:CR=1 FL=1
MTCNHTLQGRRFNRTPLWISSYNFLSPHYWVGNSATSNPYFMIPDVIES